MKEKMSFLEGLKIFLKTMATFLFLFIVFLRDSIFEDKNYQRDSLE